ncbi:lysophospholipase L1-like esterase [Cytobacillus oceanisediminis]|uniref:Lysophospholipase L1-like esterase n=1 Tax=Cytobacillus oceanisediminis TaxID=665099 RepID=A0A2V3A8L6_9BACI|nr:SGNH/GDSL hydrolase family protein [Cytobacillus oceanisediminis]PWW31263.1 lysophospholipase L1-like esterase [Cytobacillus oceanisediminis]
MKAFLTTILAIGCVVILIVGNLHWKEKTTVIMPEAAQMQTEAKGSSIDSASEEVLQLAANWPVESKKVLEKRLAEGKPFKIQIVGSGALGEGPASWPEILKTQLQQEFGESVIEISINSYDLNSLSYTSDNKQQDIIDAQPDLVILESFILKDNGAVAIEDSLANTKNVLEDVESANPETTFIIQPAHPLYNSQYYPIQVQNLKEFAEENNVTYLDHWTTWPDQDNQELTEYLSADNSQPSEKGHEIWADYMVEYFISK